MALLMGIGRGKGFPAGRTPQRKERLRCKRLFFHREFAPGHAVPAFNGYMTRT